MKKLSNLEAKDLDTVERLSKATPSASSAAASFEPAATLSGHDNWVRGLDFVHTYADEGAQLDAFFG